MMKELNKFWNRRFKSISNINNETWSKGNTYTNHWSSPTKMISIANPLRKTIWDASKEVLEEWVGVELSQTSLYGTRVYTEGSVLAPHVDRNPLVISGIINVAQDVDEPWPIEVYAHDGKAYNITMEPGDMVLYERAMRKVQEEVDVQYDLLKSEFPEAAIERIDLLKKVEPMKSEKKDKKDLKSFQE